jgi:hypothetical protein
MIAVGCIGTLRLLHELDNIHMTNLETASENFI